MSCLPHIKSTVSGLGVGVRLVPASPRTLILFLGQSPLLTCLPSQKTVEIGGFMLTRKSVGFANLIIRIESEELKALAYTKTC